MKRFAALVTVMTSLIVGVPSLTHAARAVPIGRVDIPSLNISHLIYRPVGEGPQRTIDACIGAASLNLVPGLTWLAAHRTQCGRRGFGGVETLGYGAQVLVTIDGQTHSYAMTGEAVAPTGSTAVPPPFGTDLVLQTSRDSSSVYLRFFERQGGVQPPNGRGAKLNHGETICVDSGGSEGEFALVNLTPTDSYGGGYGTLYPAGGSPGDTSAVNWDGPAPAPNTTLTQIGVGGQICVGTMGAPTHLVIDVLAISAINSFTWRAERLLDTRLQGGPVVDAQRCFNVPVNPGEWAVLNVTPIASSYGHGMVETPTKAAPTPHVSYSPGVPSPNLSFVQVDESGIVCYRSAGYADVVIDLEATASAGVIWGSPYRLLDTNQDGQPARAQYCVSIGFGRQNAWMFVNLTTVGSPGAGYGRIHSSDGYPDITSDINYQSLPDPNVSIVQLRPENLTCVASMGAPAEWTVDALGYTDGHVFRQPARRRVLDTRLPG